MHFSAAILDCWWCLLKMGWRLLSCFLGIVSVLVHKTLKPPSISVIFCHVSHFEGLFVFEFKLCFLFILFSQTNYFFLRKLKSLQMCLLSSYLLSIPTFQMKVIIKCMHSNISFSSSLSLKKSVRSQFSTSSFYFPHKAIKIIHNCTFIFSFNQHKKSSIWNEVVVMNEERWNQVNQDTKEKENMSQRAITAVYLP